MEGWRVRQRPALIAGIATPLALLGLLMLGARFYDASIRPERRPVTTFPAPGIETFVHDGAKDPDRPQRRVATDQRIEAAKNAIVRDGLPGWDGAR